MRRTWPVILSLFALPAAGYELPAGLRQGVERLIAAVEAEATTAETAAERASVLWEWANAASLEGGFVPKNLPLVAAYVPVPTPGGAINPAYVAALDVYIRQLAWLDEDAEAMGSVTLAPPAAYVAGTWQTVRVDWRVGSLGVAEGGGLLISQHIMGGYGQLQHDDPAGDNFVAIESSNPEVRFERDQAPVWGPYGGFRAARDFPVYRVRGAALAHGDTITLVYGDRSGGGRGLEIGSFTNDAIALPLAVDPGDGSFYELPLPTYRVLGGPVARVHGFAPSIVRTGEPFSISVRSEDAAYNRASGEIPPYRVLLDGEEYGELPAGSALHRLPVTLKEEGVHRFTFRSPDGAVVGEANPVWVRREPRERIYWGETHGHCGFAEGQGTPEGYFDFALEDASLDFVTLSEHDIWLTDGAWQTLNEVAAHYQGEGGLIVFPGYEWSAPRQRGGHHNVFFRRRGMERVPVQEAPSLSELYRGLRRKHEPGDVLIIPHAHQAGDWRLSDLDMETLIEIMSSHGTFEWFGQRYLEHGFRVGFAAASDDHLGHPGYAPGHPSRPGRRSNIFQFGGLAGVLAERKGNDEIFDALKARRAYATTGSQRIILDARLNGAAMGSELPEAEQRRVEGRVIGTAPIRVVELVKNGEVVAGLDPAVPSTTGSQGVVELLVGFFSESSVPFRDNPRGHRTWRGRLEVEGAEVTAARFLGTPHHTADRLEVADGGVRFDVATRGSRRTLVLSLDDSSPAPRLHFELEAAREVGTAPTQNRRPQRWAASSFTLTVEAAKAVSEVLESDGYRDEVSVEPWRGFQDDVEFGFLDSGRPGDWYYLRVEQVDGHLAWSSPWWVGGERPR